MDYIYLCNGHKPKPFTDREKDTGRLLFSLHALSGNSSKPRFRSLCFDQALFYKGFLLNTSRQIRRLAAADTASAARFDLLKSYHRQLAAQYAKPLGNKYQLIRLGSTRQLAAPHPGAGGAVLFGGVRYEMDSTAISRANARKQDETTEPALSFQQTSRSLRGNGCQNLPSAGGTAPGLPGIRPPWLLWLPGPQQPAGVLAGVGHDVAAVVVVQHPDDEAVSSARFLKVVYALQVAAEPAEHLLELGAGGFDLPLTAVFFLAR